MIRRTTGRWRWCVGLLTANLIFIWGNSLLPRSVSAAISGWLHDLLQFVFTATGEAAQGHGLLRKLAHFMEFCCLGVLLSWLFAMKKEKKWAYVLPCLAYGCLIACVDEALQCFVPGRGPSFRDVAIDSAGILLGIGLLTLGRIICEKNKKTIIFWRKTTMKKLIAMLLALTMLVAFAGCNNNETNETNAPETNAPETNAPETTEAASVAASALEILETVWGQFGEDEQFFVMGGDFENMVDGAPGAVNVAGTDFLTGNLIVPADQTANITDAASLIHGMNANTFTCAAYAVTDAQAFATAMQAAIQGNQWICGFPEKLVIAEVGGYVVVMFGHGDAVNPFQTKLAAAYPTTNVLVDEAIG